METLKIWSVYLSKLVPVREHQTGSGQERREGLLEMRDGGKARHYLTGSSVKGLPYLGMSAWLCLAVLRFWFLNFESLTDLGLGFLV